jgi:hypothetical protein
MKTILLSICATVALLAGARAQLIIGTQNTAFTQDFNTLGTANVAWVDNTTLAGWYLRAENSDILLTASAGTGTTGTPYNFGAAGSQERAIGAIGSSGNSFTNYYLRIQNNTGSTITSLDISYDGELWRSGGLQPAASNNFFAFSYAIGFPTLLDSAVTTGWTSLTALNYAPTVAVAAGAQLGAATNKTGTITGLSLDNGSEITLRWLGNDGVGTDAGIAIDNVSVTAVPEPSTYALILGAAGVLLLVRRRQRLA